MEIIGLLGLLVAGVFLGFVWRDTTSDPLQKKVAAWAANALPVNANHLQKIKEYLIELENTPDNQGEMADVLLALMLHAESKGIDLLGAGSAKFQVIKTRVYGACDERGVSRHI